MRAALQKKLCLICFMITIIGCSSQPTTPFSKVVVGTSKSDTLEILGSPTRKGRAHGMDRWVYEATTPAGKETTYVFFDGGLVKYIGLQENIDVKKFKPMPEKKPENQPGFKPIGN